jgi:hypothetical protein
MIPVSYRGALPLAIAIAMLAIPVAYHGSMEPVRDGCQNPLAPLNDLVFPNVETIESTDSIELGGRIGDKSGTLTLPGKWTIAPKFRLTRTFEIEKYYFVPRRTFTHPFPGDRLESLVVAVDGVDVPLHLRIDETYGIAVASVYFYVLGGHPVRNPFLGSLAQAVPQFLRGSLPLTLILVAGNSEFEEAATNRATLIEWAQRSWTAYDEFCNSSSTEPTQEQSIYD